MDSKRDNKLVVSKASKKNVKSVDNKNNDISKLQDERKKLLEYYDELKRRRDEIIALKNSSHSSVNDFDYICKKLKFSKGDYHLKVNKSSNEIQESKNQRIINFINDFEKINNDFNVINNNLNLNNNIEDDNVNNKKHKRHLFTKKNTLVEPNIESQAQVVVEEPTVDLPKEQELVLIEPPKIVSETIIQPVQEENAQPNFEEIKVEDEQVEIDPNEALYQKYKIKEIIFKLFFKKSKLFVFFVTLFCFLLSATVVFIILWGFASNWSFVFDLIGEAFTNFFKIN